MRLVWLALTTRIPGSTPSRPGPPAVHPSNSPQQRDVVRLTAERGGLGGSAAEGGEHFFDAGELDAGAALGAAALDFDRVELLPVGVGEVARLALAHQRFGGRGFRMGGL